MLTLIRTLFPRTFQRIHALGWLDGVEYQRQRNEPVRDREGRFSCAP
jgi:hypothetical protein